jgi:hypothetical protein
MQFKTNINHWSSKLLLDGSHEQEVTHIRESWWFESIYTMQGKTQLTRHVRFSLQSTYARHTLLTGGPRTWQPFISRQQCWTDTTAPEKKVLLTPPLSPAEWSVVLPQFLSQPSQWSSRLKPSICWRQTTRLTRHINTSMRSVRSIFALGYQPLGP